MFNSKQSKLFDTGSSKTSEKASQNSFLNAAGKKAAQVRSGNNAVKFSTTGNDFVDQFGKLGSYKEERKFEDISKDMSILWSANPYLTICFTFFIRLVTRIVSFFDGTKTTEAQRGSGLKHEGIMRMIWLHIYHKDSFWKNISLFISIGSWRDVFEMLRYDLQYNGWDNRKLDWDKFGNLILAGLSNSNTSELVKKYLPQIKAKSKCTTLETQANTLIGKFISSKLFGKENYKDYRKLKSSGTAHTWQQLISKKLMDQVDFDSIHGRALMLLVGSKFIKNNKLETKYQTWIESKPTAKYTGYPHELFINKPKEKYQIDTLNSQFMGLVEKAKNNIELGTSMIVVRDTSSSMGSVAKGTKQSCFDIAKALALFFSYLLPDGAFANSFIEFNSEAKLHQWKGSTPYEKFKNDACNFVGDTNFMGVIRLICEIRVLNKSIKEEEFPTGIICISDGEFNPSGSLNTTNVEASLKALKVAGFSQNYIDNFKIVLWNLQSNHYGPGTGEKFETYGNQKNVYYFSGYDGSVVAFLTGIKGKTAMVSNAEELFNAAMDQQVMHKIVV